MTWQRGIVLGMALGLGPQGAALAEPDSFHLGVQTHFVQGWRLEFLDLVEDMGAQSLRDELSWPATEPRPGEFDFSTDRAAFLPLAIERDMAPLILFTDTHPDYDDGQTPFSDDAQRAMARYIRAVLDHYQPGIARIEVGNEFNSDDFVSGPFAQDRTRYLAAMLRAVHEEIADTHPQVEFLCTGTHSVALGFFRALFEQGILQYCDALSVHLYRDHPESFEIELGRLTALMAELGTVLPIHVTEFGKWFDDPDQAPGFMLKMVALMAEAGVAGAWWYALLDQPWWPNMGLHDPDTGTDMPAADAFRLLQRQLLPLGRPQRIGDSPLDHIYSFGAGGDAIVAWGAPANLIVEGAQSYLDARGRPLPPVTELGHDPVIILGRDLYVQVERARDLVDTHYSFGRAPWSYHAHRADGTQVALDYIDWEWSSSLGDPGLRPLVISHDWIGGAMFDTGAYHAIERFTAPVTGSYLVTGRWYHDTPPSGDGADVTVRTHDQVLGSGIVDAQAFHFGPAEVALNAGDTLDFAVGPHLAPGADVIRRAIDIQFPPAP